MDKILSFPPRDSRPGDAVLIGGTVLETDGQGGPLAIRLIDGTVLECARPGALYDPPVAEGDRVFVVWTRGRYLLLGRLAGRRPAGTGFPLAALTAHASTAIRIHLADAFVYIGADGVVEIDGRAVQDEPHRQLRLRQDQGPAPG